MTTPFDRVSLQPAAPQWIVRISDRASDHHTIEIVSVGIFNYAERASTVEKLARYGWHFADAPARGVTVLADAHLDMVGVRIVAGVLGVVEVAKIVAGLVSRDLVSLAYAI